MVDGRVDMSVFDYFRVGSLERMMEIVDAVGWTVDFSRGDGTMFNYEAIAQEKGYKIIDG